MAHLYWYRHGFIGEPTREVEDFAARAVFRRTTSRRKPRGHCVSALAAGGEVKHQTQPERRPYVFAIDGEVSVNGVKLAKGDQARIAGESELAIKAAKDAEIILLDVPELKY